LHVFPEHIAFDVHDVANPRAREGGVPEREGNDLGVDDKR
jgi:hypothetical protein